MKRGFTLIELLVVVAIIGVLASFIIVSIRNAQSRARDTQRKSDLNQIGKALEMYFSDYEKYPVHSYDHTRFGSAASPAWAPGQLTIDLAPYIKKLPLDPLNSNTGGNFYMYYYMGVKDWYQIQGGSPVTSLDGKTYSLLTVLENQNDPDRAQVKNTKITYSPIICSDADLSPIYQDYICVGPDNQIVEYKVDDADLYDGALNGQKNRLYIVRPAN